jgi:outer membrane protein TolC
VERGLLATANPDIFPRYTRRIALSVHRILLGEEPATIPVTMPAQERLTINMATARAIGVYPNWSVVTEANLINETRERIERVLDLNGAVQEALSVNLDLAAKERFLKAGEKDVSIARSNLLPQVDLSALGVQIDKDRADASFGQQAEQTVSGSVSVTQLIYSEPVWANYSIQKNLHRSRMSEMEQLRIDIAQSAATAYLNVLRAKTFERIQKQNLNLTRSNLELARIRESIGTARAAEVLRWESELASNRRDVISTSAERNVAEISLNRILRRPAEEPFETMDVDLEDPHLLLSQGRLMKFAENQWDFKILRKFMVEEAIEYSPEIQGLDAAIAAQDRVSRSAGRAFWQPTVALQAEVSNRFVREGAGSDPLSLPSSFAELLASPDDTDWSIGLSVSFPLFNGGDKFARRSQAVQKLAQLRLERAAVVDRIEQRVRSALHLAGASYAGIQQARLAADAAEQSLDLMIDAYSRGAATIIDLIDAQNAALIASEVAASAVYDFLIDLMEVERSIGKAVLQMTDAERDAFFTRIEQFFRSSGNPEDI